VHKRPKINEFIATELSIIENTELSKYRTFAYSLSELPIIKNIITTINTLPSTRPPFIFISSSSGQGKTQLAFSLECACRRENDVIQAIAV
jgi:pantothenate kinase-related protein Tda10